MANNNTVTVIGNLVEDPELRFTSSGHAMARMRIAWNRRWQDRQSGEWKEDTDFYGVSAWRELAENAASSLHKGMRVIVCGRLSQRTWQTNEGERRSVVEIEADEIGPSLRWATADVSRARREGGGDHGGADFGGGPAGEPTGVGQAPVASASQVGEPPWDSDPPF
jgi:single-strand DNA-binding protein